MRTFFRHWGAAKFECPYPIGVDLLAVSVDKGGNGLAAGRTPKDAPRASHLLSREKEKLFLDGVTEHYAYSRRNGNGMCFERGFEIRAELVLCVVFLERIAACADAVLERVELVTPVLVTEHDAGD